MYFSNKLFLFLIVQSPEFRL